jgi:hypothetical protein
VCRSFTRQNITPIDRSPPHVSVSSASRELRLHLCALAIRSRTSGAATACTDSTVDSTATRTASSARRSETRCRLEADPWPRSTSIRANRPSASSLRGAGSLAQHVSPSPLPATHVQGRRLLADVGREAGGVRRCSPDSGRPGPGYCSLRLFGALDSPLRLSDGIRHCEAVLPGGDAVERGKLPHQEHEAAPGRGGEPNTGRYP